MHSSLDRQLRVLIVSINYAPEQTGFSQHVAASAESLASHGHAVTVLTGFPFAPYWKRWAEYRGPIVARERINGVDVIRSSHFIPSRSGRIVQRVWMEASFAFMAAASLVRYRCGPWNVIVYYGAQPSLAMLARLLAWLFRVPYVVSIQDLAAQAATDVGIVRHPILSRVLESFEYAAYRRASRALVLCDAFRDALVSHGYPAERVQVIRSPIDVDHIRPIPSSAFRSAHGVRADDFVVMYAGSMGLKQGLVNVIEAAVIARALAPTVTWVLVGAGDVRSVIEGLVRERGLDQYVKLLPLQPEDQLPNMFAAADVLLLNQVAAVKNTVIPSKLLTYMASGKPVLAAVSADSQGAAVLREANGGVLVTPDDPQRLAAAVIELSRRHRDELLAMGSRNRQFAEEHFDRKRIVALQEVALLDTVFPAKLTPATDAVSAL